MLLIRVRYEYVHEFICLIVFLLARVAVKAFDHYHIIFCLIYQTVLGKNIQRPAKLDKRLARELKGLGDPEDPYDTVIGKTMCTYDFYEGL